MCFLQLPWNTQPGYDIVDRLGSVLMQRLTSAAPCHQRGGIGPVTVAVGWSGCSPSRRNDSARIRMMNEPCQ